jgi:hypothetical protein
VLGEVTRHCHPAMDDRVIRSQMRLPPGPTTPSTGSKSHLTELPLGYETLEWPKSRSSTKSVLLWVEPQTNPQLHGRTDFADLLSRVHDTLADDAGSIQVELRRIEVDCEQSRNRGRGFTEIGFWHLGMYGHPVSCKPTRQRLCVAGHHRPHDTLRSAICTREYES